MSSSSLSGKNGSFTANLTVSNPDQTYYYKAYAVVNGTESFADDSKEIVASASQSFLIGLEPSVVVTTSDAKNVDYVSATLSASFSGATSVPSEVGFRYGTSANSLNSTIKATQPSGNSGTYTVKLDGLTPGCTYYFKAYAKVNGTGYFASGEATGDGIVKSFTTPVVPEADPVDPAVKHSWLELPGAAGNQEYVLTAYDDGQGKARNYTFNYDKDMYTSLWVAYPLYSDTTVGNNSGSWKYTPGIPQDEQINITGSTSYGVNSGSTTTDGYDSYKEYYARGHQIPNADRKSTATMNSQTYYTVNSTPQLQNGFNGSIWNTLEGAVRQQIPSSDTLYVVTGAAFQEKGSAEKPVTWIYPRGESSGNTVKRCPVPNFYWKALLKVKRNTAGAVTSASTIGFWFPHEDLRGQSYSTYAVSVASLQQMTGFDLFVNLPDSIENNAETNSDWETFTKF